MEQASGGMGQVRIVIRIGIAAAIAVGAYWLGTFVGTRMGPRQVSPDELRSCAISGSVYAVSANGTERRDPGAVVLFLPVARHPDEKFRTNSLRPGSELPPADDPVLVGIRLLGGSYLRADGGGRFQTTLSQPGDYFTLVVSNTFQRSETQALSRRDLAELGRYFLDAYRLLGNRQYRWQRRHITGDQQVHVAFRT